MKKRIALIEPEKHHSCIKSFLNKTKYRDAIDVDTFEAYNYKFPSVDDYDAFIYSGGHLSVNNKKCYPFLYPLKDLTQEIIEKNKSLLGICLGHHIIMDLFGEEIRMFRLEAGYKKIEFSENNVLFENLKNPFFAFELHADYVSDVPSGFRNFASTDLCSIQAVQYKDRPIFGLQFHPEVDPERAKMILSPLKEKLKIVGFDEEEFINGSQNYSESTGIQIFENFIQQIK